MTIFNLVLMNLEKVGIGIALFLGAYLSNMGLGMWKNIKIDGATFDKQLILQSAIKFVVLGGSIALLSVVVGLIPEYISFIGLEIAPETLETIDSLVIIGAFLTATIRYIGDGISKLKNILGNNTTSTK